MSDKQIELGRHALGLPNKRNEPYRNHFVAGEGHSDYADWLTMVENGDAVVRKQVAQYGGCDIFHLTDNAAERCLRPKERLSQRWGF